MATTPPSDVEIASLTSVRGIAAFWVVLLHFSAVLFGVLPEVSHLKPFVEAGGFAVPLFFVLSGYVLGFRYLNKLRTPTTRSTLRFLWLRLGRVYPVHLCTLFICLALVARRGWPSDEGHTIGSFIANCFLTHAWNPHFRLTWNYPAWSISSEWFAYLFFPLTAVVVGRMGVRAAAVIVVTACGLSGAVYAFEKEIMFKGFAVVVPTFVGGVALAVVCPPGDRRWGGWMAVAGLLLAVGLPYAVAPGPVQSAAYLTLFFALVAALAVAGNQAGRFWTNRVVVFLGEVSYSLYMTHAISITLLARFVPFETLTGLPLVVRYLIISASLLVVLAGAVGMYYLVERPMRGMSRRVA